MAKGCFDNECDDVRLDSLSVYTVFNPILKLNFVEVKTFSWCCTNQYSVTNASSKSKLAILGRQEHLGGDDNIHDDLSREG